MVLSYPFPQYRMSPTQEASNQRAGGNYDSKPENGDQHKNRSAGAFDDRPAVASSNSNHNRNMAPSHHFEGMDGIVDDIMSMASPTHSELHEHGSDASVGAMTHTLTATPLATPLSPLSPDWRPLVNAVHMELQENARLPTLNWNVNRTGSTHLTYNRSRSPSFSFSEPQQQQTSTSTGARSTRSDTAGSLMEHFLNRESQSSRSGRHYNYSHRGALNRGTTNHFYPPQDRRDSMSESRHSRTFSDTGSTDPLFMLDDVSPTPLSELKRQQGAYFPRRDPLPIPTSSNRASAAEQNNNPLLQEALATAAALASAAASTARSTATATATTNTNAFKPSSSFVPKQQQSSSTTARTATYNTSTSTTTLNPDHSNSTPNINNKISRSNLKPPPMHSAKHAVPIQALQNATTKKSQYGFGRQHVVPSVPAAPRAKTVAASSSKQNTNANFTAIAPSPSSGKIPATTTSPVPSSRTPDSVSPASSANNYNTAGAAYERKKQRAKNARIKLNESIDRLSHAISLAGTQSKVRASQLEQWSASTAAADGAAATTTTIKTSIGIIRECVATAEDAKKWDRPSFVGSAASLIQGMNAQCEALMREIQSLHAELRRQTQNHPHKHSLEDLTGDDGAKRRRLNGTNGVDGNDNTTTAADKLVFAERTIMDRVASFLEPLSIVRCMRVSKAWKDWGVFSNEPLWQNLAVERFGYFNVRQWRGLLEDHEQEASPATVITSNVLYKRMDAANVMPHFRHEGMLLLGEARLPGKVSAWTFLVERSNGETMRSVLRPAGNTTTGTGPYASIPVVQLWTVVQNTGIHDEAVVLRDQSQTVDASTRRRGEELKEITWDERFNKRILNLDGSVYEAPPSTTAPTAPTFSQELCRLKLFDSVILETNIHAVGCSTSSKFVQRSNFTKVLVQIRNGTTVPLVIPFPRDSSHLQF